MIHINLGDGFSGVKSKTDLEIEDAKYRENELVARREFILGYQQKKTRKAVVSKADFEQESAENVTKIIQNTQEG